MRNYNKLFQLLPVAALFATSTASATNGYFSHGYGMTAKGMGGVATALSQDTFGGANNPASMVWVGDRLDVGLDWFSPKRDAERVGAGIPSLNGKVESGHTNFFIPELGYNTMLNSNMSLGVTVYGNGGMNTSFPQGNFNCGAGAANLLCGSGKLGVDLSQLIVAPTVAYSVNPRHSVGIAALLAYQRFKAEGLQAFNNAPGFPPFTGAPGSVTNNGYDTSTGGGVRIGYLGRLTDTISVGAAYATKITMGNFDKYKGLFAQGGNFDIPANYSVGVVFSPDPALTVALDYQRIMYGKIASIANASLPVAPLGAQNGPGFGWQDVTVVKVGVAYKINDQLTLRTGYNRGSNPIQSKDVTFNILAPGVAKDHFTLGLTYSICNTCEITFAYMHVPRVTVSGSSLFNGLFPAPPNAGGRESIGLRENSLGIAWSKKF